MFSNQAASGLAVGFGGEFGSGGFAVGGFGGLGAGKKPMLPKPVGMAVLGLDGWGHGDMH